MSSDYLPETQRSEAVEGQLQHRETGSRPTTSVGNGSLGNSAVSAPSTPSAAVAGCSLSTVANGWPARTVAPEGIGIRIGDVSGDSFDESHDNYIPLDQCHSGRSHQRLSASSSTASSTAVMQVNNTTGE